MFLIRYIKVFFNRSKYEYSNHTWYALLHGVWKSRIFPLLLLLLLLLRKAEAAELESSRRKEEEKIKKNKKKQRERKREREREREAERERESLEWRESRQAIAMATSSKGLREQVSTKRLKRTGAREKEKERKSVYQLPSPISLNLISPTTLSKVKSLKVRKSRRSFLTLLPSSFFFVVSSISSFHLSVCLSISVCV